MDNNSDEILYNELLSYYLENRQNDLKEWLVFEKFLKKQGKQGLVGIFSLKTNNSKKYIFKISNDVNYLMYHEEIVMKDLNTLSKFCPHFCKSFGIIKCKTKPILSKKDKDPFNEDYKHKVDKEILLCEYISENYKLYDYIKDKTFSEEILYSIIKQVLLGVKIAQIKKDFTHYDLHSHNIMIKKCNPNIVFVYSIDEKNKFVVPTYGYYPVIIDYGFSYSSSMNDHSLLPSMAHTDIGFTSDRFDCICDPKLFLVTISDEIKQRRNTSKSRKLRKIARNFFEDLNIDLESGWDTNTKFSCSDYIIKILNLQKNNSMLLKKHPYECIDILQTLIILPLEEQSYTEIEDHCDIFIQEFMKIEKQVSSKEHLLYILKEIVNTARELRFEYLQGKDRKTSVNYFKSRINNYINTVIDFCNIETIHYEKMLCSLLLLSQDIEGVFYDSIELKLLKREKEYKKLPVYCIEQMFHVIETSLPSKYKFNTETTMVIFNVENEETTSKNISSDKIKNMNKTPNSLEWSKILYDYKNEFSQ